MEHWNDAGLQAFAEEYVKVTMPGRMLLSVDIFRIRNRWQVNLLLAEPGEQVLVDGEGREIGRYERITPLCRPVPNPKTVTLVNDMLDQASVFRNRVPSEQYRDLMAAVEALKYTGNVLADGYLVKQNGLTGLLSPEGEWIVPMEYTSVEPFPFVEDEKRSTAGLYLCRLPGHGINNMNVYDLQGNLIFRGISNLYPREHSLLSGATPELPRQKRLRSLWVSDQTIDHPFPENPEFLLTRDRFKRFSVKELSSPLPQEEALRVGILEQCTPSCPNEVPRDVLKELLTPMAEAMSNHIPYSSEQILNRLRDYEAFQKERSGPQFLLREVTTQTPLNQLNLSSSALTCLLRNNLRCAGDLLVSKALRNCTPKIQEEVDQLRERLRAIL